jgi:hypothetical protein
MTRPRSSIMDFNAGFQATHRPADPLFGY